MKKLLVLLVVALIAIVAITFMIKTNESPIDLLFDLGDIVFSSTLSTIVTLVAIIVVVGVLGCALLDQTIPPPQPGDTIEETSTFQAVGRTIGNVVILLIAILTFVGLLIPMFKFFVWIF